MTSDFEAFLGRGLVEIEQRGLLRKLQEISPAQAPRVSCQGREVHNFSSNDYLGLATHPTVQAASAEACRSAGAGSGASRLISGTLPEHSALEEALAAFKRTPSALTFSSGYAAALGTIPALAGKDDAIIADKLCHACLIDGARLSGATLRVFPHNDVGSLETKLRAVRGRQPDGRILILLESVYSMDGDLAPLEEIIDLKERYGAWLFLDEAHGVGVLGENGRGLADSLGVADRIEVQMGTLGKALGSSGAYICGSKRLRDFLINCARSFIFSTAPPPAAAAAARASLGILESDEGRDRIQRLAANTAYLCEGLGIPGSPTPIVPLVLGPEEAAVSASAALGRAGFLVPAIRFPTVARGAARLRFTLSATHSRKAIEELARVGVDLFPPAR